jgi:hypothetical protein
VSEAPRAEEVRYAPGRMGSSGPSPNDELRRAGATRSNFSFRSAASRGEPIDRDRPGDAAATAR